MFVTRKISFLYEASSKDEARCRINEASCAVIKDVSLVRRSDGVRQLFHCSMPAIDDFVFWDVVTALSNAKSNAFNICIRIVNPDEKELNEKTGFFSFH